MTTFGRQHGSLLLALPAALLVLLALRDAPRHPYTGFRLQGYALVAVAPGSPAQAAGLEPGDLLLPPGRGQNGLALREALRALEPGRPTLLRVSGRAGERRLTLTPSAQSAASVRFITVLALLSAGFLLLGVWVLGRRSDRLGQVFFLLCWAFAVVLCPTPRFPALAWMLAYEALYPLVSILLPALFVHFFALFPQRQGTDPRPLAGVHAAYAVSVLLGAANLAHLAHNVATGRPHRGAEALLHGVAASYFALALLGALALFARSYLRAPSPDARRRLRVALLGTALGVAPVAAAVLVRNLLPQLALPGERWMPLTLVLIPASFAYAIAVHHIFDFRIALRFSVTYLSVAALIAALYLVAQPLLRRGFPDLAPAQTAVTLAFLAALAALAGPVRPWLQRLTERLMPIEEEAPAAALLDGFQPPAPAGIEQVLESAALALRQGLRLSGCGAVEFAPEGPRWIGWWGDGHGDVPRFTPALHSALDARRCVVSLEDPDTVLLADEDRLALGEVGATLLVPLAAADEVRAALVLGQRLSGRWFSRRERHALHAFARQTSVALENAILHGADRRHGELRREMAAARHIQDHLLPLRPPVFPTLDCAGSTHSCEEVGGDYYDFVERSPRDLVFAVGDCAGKGVPAALLMASLQAGFRQEAAAGSDPAELLARLNRQLAVMAQPDRFVCLFCAQLDVRSARLIYANAGLPPAQLRRANGVWCALEESGLLIGVRADSAYVEAGLSLGAGDLLVLATDGLTEARRGDELFGAQRLRRVVDAHAHLRAARICDAVIREVRAFTSDERLDDHTVVVLKQLAAPARRAEPRAALRRRARD